MTRTLGLGPLALAFALLAAACSSSPDETADDPSASADELGGACGGIANLGCKSGYSCSITSKLPDASGTCKKVCGGIANIGCNSTSTCVITDKNPDATGLCAKKADAQGSMCGGIANVACASGYSCVTTATTPDASGSCQKVCGGIANLSCGAGLECVVTAKHPDATGTCAKPASGTAPTVVEVGSASGSTVAVKEGQDILVKLAGPSPGTLFGWQVVSTTRSLGYPEQGWSQGDGAAGKSGFSTFLWHTGGRPISVVGSHHVVLEIDRGHGDPATTFEFTANITR